MRATEFLVEYNRQKTAQMLGKQLVNAFVTGGDSQQYRFYDTTYQTPDKQPNVPVILNHLFINFEEADPTPNKIYVPWIAREYAKGNLARLEDVHAWMPSMLSDYDKYKKRSDFNQNAKDIMRLSWPELYNIMGIYEPQIQLTNKGQSKEVYRDGDVRIIVPLDEEAACYYGQGTRWCTAATKGNNYFDQYNRQSPLYILLPTKPRYDGEKYQLHFGSGQFMDEEDEPVGLSEIITRRFNLLPFFEKVEPEINYFVIFAPDQLLAHIGKQIQEHARQYAMEVITNWELDDVYYREWQFETALDMGIINPDTMEEDEMWEIIYDNDNLNNYFEYNPDAADWYKKINDAINLTPSEMKMIADDMAKEGYDNSNDLIPYQKLEAVYKYSLDNEFGRSRRGSSDMGLSEWLEQYIAIAKDGTVKLLGSGINESY